MNLSIQTLWPWLPDGRVNPRSQLLEKPMSYSFNVRAASKRLVLALVAAALDKVVAEQACHEVDKKQALAAADSFINLLPDDDAKDVVVSVNGYVSGQWHQGSTLERLTGASVTVSANLVDKLPQA